MIIAYLLVVAVFILVWKVAEDLYTLRHEMSLITQYMREVYEIYREWVDDYRNN